jgi:hypothetical protein
MPTKTTPLFAGKDRRAAEIEAQLQAAEGREAPAPAAPASAPSAEFFKGKQQPKAERDAGLRAALAKRGFAAGGSIDGCAQRGKTKANRS